DLDVLAGRDVPDTTTVVVGDVVQAMHLSGGDEAARDLDALHVARVIELVVEAVAEAHGPELFGGDGPLDVSLDAPLMAGKPVALLAITRKWHGVRSPALLSD